VNEPLVNSQRSQLAEVTASYCMHITASTLRAYNAAQHTESYTLTEILCVIEGVYLFKKHTKAGYNMRRCMTDFNNNLTVTKSHKTIFPCNFRVTSLTCWRQVRNLATWQLSLLPHNIYEVRGKWSRGKIWPYSRNKFATAISEHAKVE